jgi:hypothetical protein
MIYKKATIRRHNSGKLLPNSLNIKKLLNFAYGFFYHSTRITFIYAQQLYSENNYAGTNFLL